MKALIVVLFTASLFAQDVSSYMIGTTHMLANNTNATTLTNTVWLAFGFYNREADTITNVRAYLGGTASGVGAGDVTMGIHLPSADGKPGTLIDSVSTTTSPSPIVGTAGTPVDWTFSQPISAGYYWTVAKNTGGGTMSLRFGAVSASPFLFSGQQVSSSWTTATWNGSTWTSGGNTPYVLITFASGRKLGVPVTAVAGDAANSAYLTREPANSLAPQSSTVHVSAVCVNLTRNGVPTTPVKFWVGHSPNASTGTITKTYTSGALWRGSVMDTSMRAYCDYFNSPVTIPAGQTPWVGISGGDSSSAKYAVNVVYTDSTALEFKPLGATFRYFNGTGSATDVASFATVSTSQYFPFVLLLTPGDEVRSGGGSGGSYTFVH
jgi:hypothetical protein